MLKRSFVIMMMLILCIYVVGCVDLSAPPSGVPSGDSSSSNSSADYSSTPSADTFSAKEVYLKEDGRYIPYLVVSENYDGNLLLLRKNIMDQDRAISDYSAEYENSPIDVYLSTDFLDLFEDAVRQKMTGSDIAVTSKDALYVSGKQTYTINRKAFLLSFSEVNCGEHGMAAVEGSLLPYFSGASSRIAFKGNTAYSWWLRTPYTGYESVSWGITDRGARVELSSSKTNGIRPAISFSQDTKFVLSNEVFENQSVYVIE